MHINELAMATSDSAYYSQNYPYKIARDAAEVVKRQNSGAPGTTSEVDTDDCRRCAHRPDAWAPFPVCFRYRLAFTAAQATGYEESLKNCCTPATSPQYERYRNLDCTKKKALVSTGMSPTKSDTSHMTVAAVGAWRIMALEMPVSASMNEGMRTSAFIKLW